MLLVQVVAAGKVLPPDIARPLFDRMTHPLTPYRLSLEIYQTLRQLLASNPNLWTPRPKDWPLFLGVLRQICSIGDGNPQPGEDNGGDSVVAKKAGSTATAKSLQHNYLLRKAVLLLQCFVAALYDDVSFTFSRWQVVFSLIQSHICISSSFSFMVLSPR